MHVLSRVRQQLNFVHVKDERSAGAGPPFWVDLKKRAQATEDDQNEMTKKRKKVRPLKQASRPGLLSALVIF